jgi:putative transposase
MKYEAIDQGKTDFPVSRQCVVLGVSESGYYAWRTRPPSRREQENIMLREAIYGLWEQYHGIYGAPRIVAELRDQGLCVGRHRVARLMREMGIQGKMPQKRLWGSKNQSEAKTG